MTHHPALSDPPPRTLAERLDRLNDNLQSLHGRLHEAIASAVGSAVADAVRDAVRGLLGGNHTSEPEPVADSPHGHYRDPDRADPGWEDSGGLWHGHDPHPEPARPQPQPTPAQKPSRWRDALSAGVQAAVWWLRRQGRQRPLVTTAVVALAAAAAAFLGGPTLGAGVGVLTSLAGLLWASDDAGQAADTLTTLAAD